MLSSQLKRKIRELWDSFWSGGVANPLTAIEQITYLVFLKRLEDLDTQRAQAAQKAKREYISIFEGQDEYRWSVLRKLPSQERFDRMRKDVFDWLKSIGGSDQERMRDAVFLIPNPNLLTRAVDILDDLFVPERNQDTLGDIYEDLLQEIAVAGKNGQFRTPRHIIRAMCDLVDVKYGERICDPACGTGGFLVNAYQHILQSNTSPDILRFADDATPLHAIGDKLTAEEHDELRSNHLYGFDFDRTMVRLGWMNMIQHGLEKPKVRYADSLGSTFYKQHLDPSNRDENGRLTFPSIFSSNPDENIDEDENRLYAEFFDVVLANPPFTGNIDKSDIGESLRPLGTTKTELLFVDLILQLLKPGGRAAVIVPEGVLFGVTNAHQNLRRKLIEQTQIQAIISLPSGVFQPYTGVKTSILVFIKGGQTEKIWFYEVTADGETLNAKRDADPDHNDLWDMRLKFRLCYSQQPPAFLVPHENEWRAWQEISPQEQSLHYLQPKFTQIDESDDEGNPLLISKVKGFEIQSLGTAKDWTVTQPDIADKANNLSARRYKPFTLENAAHTAPEVLIGELKELEGKIQIGLDRLLEMLEGK